MDRVRRRWYKNKFNLSDKTVIDIPPRGKLSTPHVKRIHRRARKNPKPKKPTQFKTIGVVFGSFVFIGAIVAIVSIRCYRFYCWSTPLVGFWSISLVGSVGKPH